MREANCEKQANEAIEKRIVAKSGEKITGKTFIKCSVWKICDEAGRKKGKESIHIAVLVYVKRLREKSERTEGNEIYLSVIMGCFHQVDRHNKQS